MSSMLYACRGCRKSSWSGYLSTDVPRLISDALNIARFERHEILGNHGRYRSQIKFIYFVHSLFGPVIPYFYNTDDQTASCITIDICL